LIEAIGCNVNAQDNHKNTPLHDTLFHSDPNTGCYITVLAYLINQNDININIKNKDGYSIMLEPAIFQTQGVP
jgi:hypothetical protein